MFVALDNNNKPRIIFPTKAVKLPEKEDSEKEVILNLQTKPSRAVTVEFDYSTEANEFYSFVKDRLKE